MDLSSRKIKKYIREGYDLNLISRIQSDIPDFKYDDRRSSRLLTSLSLRQNENRSRYILPHLFDNGDRYLRLLHFSGTRHDDSPQITVIKKSESLQIRSFLMPKILSSISISMADSTASANFSYCMSLNLK